jgi:hypothetical protein
MSAIEGRLVAVRDSPAWRRSVGRLGRTKVVRNDTVRRLGTARRYVAASVAARRHRDAFADVRTFVVFIGHVKSGGTMLGALLDAHRHAVIADEADALRYVEAGFGAPQLYQLLAKGARREAMKGRVTARRLDAYSFDVPGQWQGRHDRVHVVGDSRAGPTTRRLGAQPELVARLDHTLGTADARFVHVVRNPFDPISAMVRRGRRSYESAIADYHAQCRRVDEICRRASGRVLRVHYETFIADPVAGLRELCGFVGLGADASYLDACASVVDRDRPKERAAVAWRPHHRSAVDRIIGEVSFLQGYTFDEVAP